MELLTAAAIGAAGAARGDMMGVSKAVLLRSPNSTVMSSRFLSSVMAGYTSGCVGKGYRYLGQRNARSLWATSTQGGKRVSIIKFPQEQRGW